MLSVERPLLPGLDALSKIRMLGRAVIAFRRLFVFACVSLAWVFFKLPNFDHALGFFAGMFVGGPIAHPARIYRSLALIYALPVIVQHLVPRDWLEGSQRALEPYLYAVMATLMLVEAGPDTSFDGVHPDERSVAIVVDGTRLGIGARDEVTEEA